MCDNMLHPGFWIQYSRVWNYLVRPCHTIKSPPSCELLMMKWSTFLTHWGWVTHICVRDLTSIGSDNGLLPGRRQAIIRTNAGILLIRPLRTNFSEFLVEILIFSFKKMRLKVSSAKRRPFCLGLNELTGCLKKFSVLQAQLLRSFGSLDHFRVFALQNAYKSWFVGFF